MTSKTIRIPAEEVAKAYSHRTDRLCENASSQKLSKTAKRDESVDKTAEGMETAERAQNPESADAEGPDMEVSDVNAQSPEMTDVNVQRHKAVYANERDTEATDMGVQNLETTETQGQENADRSDASEEEEYFDDPLTLAPYHRGMFAGFTEVEGLEDQIANAILQAMAKGNDRTSRNGNILIFGAHGSGKTTLATNIAKAIAQEKGRQTVKMAKIYAADLNRRDIAATVAKIAGGTLIVEEAGDLADDTVEQLTTAMEFRTDGLIVILEDEQRYIHNLLMNHPRFTMKFTAQIYLPAYTVDELCMFALRHANSMDYSISEDGFEVIRQKVAQMSSTETPMSIGDVIAMVDQAIRRSNKFMRKMSMGKKRYDENDYVLLFAKDFK